MSVLFGALTLALQVVDVKPYPNMKRDYLIGTIGFGVATFLFLLLAIRGRIRCRRREMNDCVANGVSEKAKEGGRAVFT